MTTELRVFGPPGTGKTTYLSGQIALAAERYDPDRILAASFTKAAAWELNSRELPIDEKNIGTLHAICYRLLRRAGFPTDIAETAKGVRKFNESQGRFKLTIEGAGDIDEPVYAQPTKGTDALLQGYNRFRALRLPEDELSRFVVNTDSGPRNIREFAIAWERFKYEASMIDFTDMIALCVKHDLGPPEGVDIAFFDEVQDFTPLELALVRQWKEKLQYIVLAGDDDQCIYSFKGATPDAFLSPEIPVRAKRYLEQSYRMPAAVHIYSQQWIGRVKHREDKFFSPRDELGSVEYDGGIHYAAQEALQARIRGLLQSTGGSIMFLSTCGYMMAPTIKALRQLGVPFHNPYRRKRGDWNPLGRTGRNQVSTVQRIEALLRPQLRGEQWNYIDVRRWLPLVKVTGNFKRGATKALEGPPGGHICSLDTLHELMEAESWAQLVSDPIQWLQSRAKTEKKSQVDFVSQIIKQHGFAAVKEEPRVVVGTIHSVKGGQADTVVMFPDVSKAGREWALSDSTIRQFYVGMTRARERLILTRPAVMDLYVKLPRPEVLE